MNINLRKAACLPAAFLLLFSCASAYAQNRLPRFEDYSVGTIYRGNNAPVKLDEDSRAFRTRLREATREKPNFAGRFIVTAWGCGTGCVLGAVIDASTGKVY